MSKSEVIRGAGGGGKSGGGSARVAQEAPDSLRSKQFARVVDLVSEGEIEGLVNGLKSVYLDDTPVQNPDGSFNFDGVTLISRTGEQNQAVIPGFAAVESEAAVGVEMFSGEPIVRTITTDEVDYARVTVSVPRLTRQNVTNGDVTGTSVRIAIDVQSDGGGFVAQKIVFGTIPLQVSGSVASSVNKIITGGAVQLNWTGGVVTSPAINWYSQPRAAAQSINWRVDYRLVGSPSWLALRSGSFNGSGRYEDRRALGASLATQRVYVPPTAAITVPFDAPTDGVYEFRYVILSGSGTLAISGNAQTFLTYDDITGKTSSKYQRAYRIALAGSPPWDVRVRRLTADSTSQALQNQTFWDSYTEVVDQRLRYPNRAIMALSVDAERFGAIPVRGYEIKGVILQVPSNYDPVTRTYSGIWNGTFKPAWSDNPAWIFYDLITNARYGCGQFINSDLVDKWALYEISQYCDEMVSDGRGGVEPRFTCNVYLQQREQAHKVLEALASVFRAVTYYSGGMIVPVQDAPKEATALFTPANVVNGEFNYSGSSAKTRATVVLVSWNDPQDRYRQAIEYVEDAAGVAERGIIQKEVDAIACTSRGQAHRFGRAIIFSESMEVEANTFAVGLDGVSLAPGDVIKTTDPVRAGSRKGGRIMAATASEITLDADVEISAAEHTLWLVMPDGSVESRIVANAPGTTDVLTVTSPFSDVPLDYSIWVLGASDLVPEEWRVISISENDDYTAQVTVLEYRSDKYDAIENGIVLDDRPTTGLTARTQAPVTNVVIEEDLYLINAALVGATMSVSWQGESSYYEVEYRRDEGNYQRVTSSASSVDIQPVTPGEYVVRVVAVNAIGVRSQPVSTTFTVNGLNVPPADVAAFNIQAINGNAHLTFAAATDLDVKVGGYLRVRHSPLLSGATWSSAVNIGQQLPGNSTNAVLPLLQGTYLAKWVDSSGNQSVNAVSIITNAPSVINLNLIETVTEHPGFTGATDGAVVSTFGGSQAVVIDSVDLIDDRLDLMDDWGLIDSLGGIRDAGIYYFSKGVDLGSVVTSIVTGRIEAQGFNTSNNIDDWPDIDSLESIDGDDPSLSSVTLQIRTTDDDPSADPQWSAWRDFAVGDFTARAFEFRVWMETELNTQNVALINASVAVDMPDKLQSGDDLIAPVGGLVVNFDPPFFVKPAIGISAQSLDTGDHYEIINKTREGFKIMFYNSANDSIERRFDYIARAY